MLVAMAVAGALGLAFERFIVRPVYGQHLKQILITMGGMIIGEELIKVIWGPAQIPLPLPGACAARCWWATPPSRNTAWSPWPWAGGVRRAGLDAARTKGGPADPRGRAGPRRWSSRWATASGACLWACSWRLGAGWPGRRDVGPVPAERHPADGRAGQRADLHRHHHRRPGLDGRCARIGALLVGLMANYTGFLVPKVALFSSIALMVAVLLWRPQGVYPVTNR